MINTLVSVKIIPEAFKQALFEIFGDETDPDSRKLNGFPCVVTQITERNTGHLAHDLLLADFGQNCPVSW